VILTTFDKQPVRVTWTFDELVSSDAHVVRCRFGASVRVADTDPDRRMFAEVFLTGGKRGATDEEIRAHFDGAVRAAALSASAKRQADDWISGDRKTLQDALVERAKSVAFACGLEVLPPFQVELESPTLARQQLEAVQRARAEERAAGQVQHLQRAAELLKQFQSMRAAAPELSAGRLLDQMAPADRGLALQTLLMASAGSAQQTLWAVAGQFLVRIEARSAPPTIQLIELPAEAGPLRSVQGGALSGRRVLLIGARSGVIVFDPETGDHTIYRDDSVVSQLGFNRVVARGDDEIWACHGEAGVVGWKSREVARGPHARHAVESVDVPVPSVASANTAGGASILVTSPSIGGSSGARGTRPTGPRNLHVLDGTRLLFSAGPELHVLVGERDETIAAESQSEIIAVVAAERAMLIVHQDGTILSLDRQTRAIVGRQHRGAGICAAASLPWLDSMRLLLANETGPIDCIGQDDPLLTQYLSPHRGLRALTAAADLVAAVSSDRQRVILWQSWDGRAPVAEVHLTAQARHRIADVEFC
jgi:hypothetical protein